MTSITIPIIGLQVDLQTIMTLVGMGAGIIVGWGICSAHRERHGWQYCTCPDLDCGHCTKDYAADSRAVVDEALSGCDVHHDMEKA